MAQIDHADRPVGSRDHGWGAQAEREPPAEVRRPWLVAVLAGAVLMAASSAVGGLGGLSQRERPMTLSTEADLLEAALQEAPFIERGGAGPVVWAVAPLRCGQCTSFFEKDLPALRAEGLRVRLILIASPSEPLQTALLGASAQVVRVGDVRRAAPPSEEAFITPALALREANGDGEWARASLDRITAILAANGASMELPCLLWRRGVEWRAAFGRSGRNADHALKELAPET